MKISFVIPVVAVVAIAAAGCPREPAVATPFQLLQANVGTARLDAGRYVYKLNDVAAERAIAAGIVALDPDVVALQEIRKSHAAKLAARSTGCCRPPIGPSSANRVRATNASASAAVMA